MMIKRMEASGPARIRRGAVVSLAIITGYGALQNAIGPRVAEKQRGKPLE